MKAHPNKLLMILIAGLISVSGVFAQASKADSGIALLESLQMSFRSVAQKALPSVVEINVVEVVKQPTQMFPFFFNDRRQQPDNTQEFRREGLGSGVIVRRDGDKFYVLTNAHVVGDAKEITVSLNDNQKYDATLVGSDERKDLALISFKTKDDLPVAELGDSDQMQVGDWVLALGNPLGFQSTVTAGIVSAVGRQTSGIAATGGSLSNFTDYIQTDAAINQGNSGGALVNLKGQVIGLNTWIASTSGGNIGLGFAIPINNAKKAIDDFITKGKVEYGWLGITIAEPSTAIQDDLGLKGKNGSFVYSVFQGGPADKAGIRPGDFVTAVNGTQVKDTNGLLTLVGNISPGNTARFELIRSGKKVELQVKITARDTEKAIADQSKQVWPGFSVVKVTDAIREQLKLSKNAGNLVVAAVDEGSAAAIAGFQSGDIVQSVNGKSVKDLKEFYDQLNAGSQDGQVLFTLNRQGNKLTVGLER